MPWNAVDQLTTGESGEAPAISLPPAQTSLVNDEENLAKSMPVELRKGAKCVSWWSVRACLAMGGSNIYIKFHTLASSVCV